MLSKIINNLFVWAIVITIALSFVLSKFFKKYEAEILSMTWDIMPKSVAYSDIDGDGISEKIVLRGEKEFPCIEVFKNGKLLFGMDISRNMPLIFEPPASLDYNMDGVDELFFISQTEDSLFMNMYRYKNSKFATYEKFICLIDKNRKSDYDYGIVIRNEGGDINGDGNKELFFVIKSGFSYQPRHIFCYDIAKDTIFSSPKTGAYLSYINICTNPTNHEKILLTENYSLNNYAEHYSHIPYPDTSAYIMAFDSHLNYLFEPIRLPSNINFVATSPFLKNDSLYILASSANFGNEKDFNVDVYNTNGKFINNINFVGLHYLQVVFLSFSKADAKYCAPFADRAGNLYLINQDAKTFVKKNVFKSEFDVCTEYRNLDLDGDGNLEKILCYPTGIAIVQHDLSDVTHLEINNPMFLCYSEVKLADDQPPCFSLFSNRNSYVIKYEKNKFYYWQYALYLTIAIILYALFYFIQKKKLQQLKRENMKLNQIIAQRTHELQEQTENLKRLDIFKQNMVSMIVHDLKNPLNLILNKTDNPEIISSSRQMTILVENMLDVNRFEEDKLRLNIEFISLNRIINEAYLKVKYLIELKTIDFDNSTPDNIEVRTDSIILERVFINLLTNAAKFTPNNGQIKIYTKDISDNILEITVQDNGIGIASHLKDKIFDKYVSQQGAAIKGLSSSGLGLTFCKLAIEAQNCQIRIDSEQQKGTKIIFTLPYKTNTQTDTRFAENKKTIIQLNLQEKSSLLPYYQILTNTEIYEISKLYRIQEQINADTNINQLWKDNFNKVVESGNKELYQYLTKLIES